MIPIRPKRPRQRLDANAYDELSQRVLQRDGWRCQACGSMQQLQVHHKQFRSHSGDDSEENLITLCGNCHNLVHCCKKRAGIRKASGTLAAFLVAKKATRNRTRAFLAAALWLQDRGKERLSTGDISRALYENKQGKLANASQRLAHNVKRGLCAKVGRTEFYVTAEGRAELG